MQISPLHVCSVAALALSLCQAALAQDTRNVGEPKFPPACIKLSAALTSTPDRNGGTLREEDEQKLDTMRIQQAMDACPAGHAVELTLAGTHNAFLSGPLDLRSGVTLLVDRGVTLFGSRDPAVYEIKLDEARSGDAIRCGTSLPRPGKFGQQEGMEKVAGLRHGGCRPLLSASNVKNAGLMGDGIVDGRGYATLLGKDFSWWQMARRAEPHDDIYFSTKLLVASHADGLTLYRITLHNSPNYHVTIGATDGFTAWNVHLFTPVDPAQDARNTDGIDPGNSTNITIAHSWIDNGDDNVALKSGATHVSVLDNHFYRGHGMSIGSETVGQAFLLVDGLTEDHTSSGIRIKSNVTRGGLIHDLTYRNICMRGVANPIAISPYYTNQTTEGFVDPHYTGTHIPDYKSIRLENIISETPGDVLIAGLDDQHRTQVELRNVQIKGITPAQIHFAFADIAALAPGSNLVALATGKDASVRILSIESRAASTARLTPSSCEKKFLPMR